MPHPGRGKQPRTYPDPEIVLWRQFRDGYNQSFQDFDVTDSGGNFSMHGVDGSYALLAFPPVSSSKGASSATAMACRRTNFPPR